VRAAYINHAGPPRAAIGRSRMPVPVARSSVVLLVGERRAAQHHRDPQHAITASLPLSPSTGAAPPAPEVYGPAPPP
jgi:hypothetical protein